MWINGRRRDHGNDRAMLPMYQAESKMLGICMGHQVRVLFCAQVGKRYRRSHHQGQLTCPHLVRLSLAKCDNDVVLRRLLGLCVHQALLVSLLHIYTLIVWMQVYNSSCLRACALHMQICGNIKFATIRFMTRGILPSATPLRRTWWLTQRQRNPLQNYGSHTMVCLLFSFNMHVHGSVTCC
eukprot:SAG31_NODE_1537_length_7982_cov_2.277813_6_plen_182_part_00